MGRKRWGGSFFAAHLATTSRVDVRAFGHSVVDNNGATPLRIFDQRHELIQRRLGCLLLLLTNALLQLSDSL
jgi:hypothetical protein